MGLPLGRKATNVGFSATKHLPHDSRFWRNRRLKPKTAFLRFPSARPISVRLTLRVVRRSYRLVTEAG